MDKRSSLFNLFISDEETKLYNFNMIDLFRKHFMYNLDLSKTGTSVYCMHAPMQCLQNALVYFDTALNYACKMFMILTPGANIIKLFTSVI
jgi:hypothetical protein